MERVVRVYRVVDESGIEKDAVEIQGGAMAVPLRDGSFQPTVGITKHELRDGTALSPVYDDKKKTIVAFNAPVGAIWKVLSVREGNS